MLRTVDGSVYALTPELFQETAGPPEATPEATAAIPEVRLIVLGDGGVGKTTLIRRLVEGQFRSDTVVTQGVHVLVWRPTPDLQVHIWDFGGQEIYHGLSQLFFVNNAVYLLILDSRRDTGDEYWLSLLRSLGIYSPVIVALNKASLRTIQPNEGLLTKKYPNITAFVETDAQTGLGIAELGRAMTSAVVKLPGWNAAWPAAWVSVRGGLSELLRITSVSTCTMRCAAIAG